MRLPRARAPAMAVLRRLLLLAGPVTARDLAQAAGLSERTARRYLSDAQRLGLAHASGKRRERSHGRYSTEVSDGPSAAIKASLETSDIG